MFQKDIQLSIFEQGSKGALGESAIETISFQEKHVTAGLPATSSL